MCAVTRVICVLLELNQTDEGINVPKALRPWMPESKPIHHFLTLNVIKLKFSFRIS